MEKRYNGKKETPSIKKQRRDKGFILFISMFIILLVFLVTTPFLFKVSSQKHLSEVSLRSKIALNLAEAGIERTIWELNFGDISTWAGDAASRTLQITDFQNNTGNIIGDIAVQIINPGSDTPIVVSMGSVPWKDGLDVEKTVRVLLVHGWRGYFDFAVFADQGMTLGGNPTADSYNSEEGPYDPDNFNSNADFGTNADTEAGVILMNNVWVYGDFYCGPTDLESEEVIVEENRADVTGEIGEMDDYIYFPPFDIDPYLPIPNEGDYYQDGGEVTITSDVMYTSFLMESNSIFNVAGGGTVTIYVDGDFTMDSNTEFNIAADTRCQLVMGNGSFWTHSLAEFNNLSGDVLNLAILGTDTFVTDPNLPEEEQNTMTFSSNSDFIGVIYVPDIYLVYEANHDLFGSVICDFLDLNSSTHFHYDEKLAGDTTYGYETEDYVMKSWQMLFKQ